MSLPDFNDIQIVFSDNGSAYIGHVLELDNEEIVLSKAVKLRIWGTTWGLNELRSGKTNETVYDPCGTVRCKWLIRFNVEKGAWDADLDGIKWDEV